MIKHGKQGKAGKKQKEKLSKTLARVQYIESVVIYYIFFKKV